MKKFCLKEIHTTRVVLVVSISLLQMTKAWQLMSYNMAVITSRESQDEMTH